MKKQDTNISTYQPNAQQPVVFVRVPPEVLVALDRYVDRVRASRPGNRVTRADVVREILMKAIGWPESSPP